VCCDCAGRVYVEKDINVLSTADRAAKDVMMTLEDTDRRLDTDVEFARNSQKVACVLASGIYLDGSDYKPVMSACPGELYSGMGIDVTNVERLLLHDQTEANHISGRLFSIANQDVTEVRMSLAGDYPVELVPQVWWKLKDMDTKRADIDLENVNAVIRHISYKIDLLAGTVYPEIVLEPEAPDLIGSGDTVVPPVDPTTNPLTPPGEIPVPDPISITTIGRFGWSYNVGDGIHGIKAGFAGIIGVPYGATPDLVNIIVVDGTSGTISIDLWKCTYAQIAAGVHPVVGDSICGAHKITLASQPKNTIDISDWIKTWAVGDQLYVTVDTLSALTMVCIEIYGVASQ
jgi:hypothetical protein